MSKEKETKWIRITDPRTTLTLEEHHGRILKVGKHNFVRMWIKGGWDFWNYGFTDIIWINDTPIYFKEGAWYAESNIILK